MQPNPVSDPDAPLPALGNRRTTACILSGLILFCIVGPMLQVVYSRYDKRANEALTPSFSVNPIYDFGRILKDVGLIMTVLFGIMRQKNWPAFSIRQIRSADILNGSMLFIVIIVVLGVWSLVPGPHGGGWGREGDTVVFLALPILDSARVIVSATWEEVLFRGYFQTAIGGLANNPHTGVFATAGLFALGHLDKGWHGMAGTFFTGICFGYAVRQFRCIWPGTIAHICLNLPLYAGLYFSFVNHFPH